MERVFDEDGGQALPPAGAHPQLVPGRCCEPSPLSISQRRERLMQPSLHLGEPGAMVFILGEVVLLVRTIRDVVEFFIAVGLAEVVLRTRGRRIASRRSAWRSTPFSVPARRYCPPSAGR